MDFAPLLDLFEQFGMIAVLAYLLFQERSAVQFWQSKYTALSEKLLDSVLEDARRT